MRCERRGCMIGSDGGGLCGLVGGMSSNSGSGGASCDSGAGDGFVVSAGSVASSNCEGMESVVMSLVVSVHCECSVGGLCREDKRSTGSGEGSSPVTVAIASVVGVFGSWTTVLIGWTPMLGCTGASAWVDASASAGCDVGGRVARSMNCFGVQSNGMK